ncbi:MAG: hypothetical protein GWO24_08455, partial [Akkermansiaceae bacterium]|nr:hypothetical protein [Akkermansiaceae bacterium]
TPVTAFVPTDGALGDSWTQPGFDDSNWLTGTGGVGYERATNQNYTPLLGIDLLSPSIPAEMRIDADGDDLNDNNSCYARYEFEVEDRNTISFLNLRMKYDD